MHVIGSAGSTRVKIGTSVSPEKRLKELQTGNPDRLEVLWYTSGGRELEALLHRAFADHRVEGEWFDFGDVQPVGAIPAAVHQHSGITSRGGRPNTRTAPKRSGARAARGEPGHAGTAGWHRPGRCPRRRPPRARAGEVRRPRGGAGQEEACRG
ncbi:GIY-YIG nuclease family protein [Streptomyces atratus]|uniref:GIY-YIG nuclease family protein n=1 Tax=Streptomyces atratus TaxID=1893 RepID=UPI00366232E4